MRRGALPLAAAVLMLAGAAPVLAARPAASRPIATKPASWTETYAATPEGGFRRGNPAAQVKLVEYGSLTCPHCAAFHREAMTALLADYIATGRVSYEYRSFALNGPDFAAALIARCSGNAKTFFSALNSFYPDQAQWTAPFASISEDDSRRLQALTPDKQVAALALVGKLDVYAARLGMTRARFDQCLADKSLFEKLTAIRTLAVNTDKLTGTPSFLINGVKQDDVYGWSTLEPALQAALKP